MLMTDREYDICSEPAIAAAFHHPPPGRGRGSCPAGRARSAPTSPAPSSPGGAPASAAVPVDWAGCRSC